MSMTLKPIVGEGKDGVVIYHDDEPTVDEYDNLVIKEFVAYNGEAIPDSFTIWASRSHKTQIKTGRWANPQDCYLFIQPNRNRYHSVNMYRGNVALNYKVYTQYDLINLLSDAEVDDVFRINKRLHLDIIFKDMVALH